MSCILDANINFSCFSLQDLARAGFFFTGQPDSVQCHECTLVVRNWDWTADPAKIHIKMLLELNKECGFASQHLADGLPRSSGDGPLCNTCLEMPSNSIFIPCGHIYMCHDCSRKLGRPNCPICNQESEIIKIYFHWLIQWKILLKCIDNCYIVCLSIKKLFYCICMRIKNVIKNDLTTWNLFIFLFHSTMPKNLANTPPRNINFFYWNIFNWNLFNFIHFYF